MPTQRGTPEAWSGMTNRRPARNRLDAWGGGEVRIAAEGGSAPARGDWTTDQFPQGQCHASRRFPLSVRSDGGPASTPCLCARSDAIFGSCRARISRRITVQALRATTGSSACTARRVSPSGFPRRCAFQSWLKRLYNMCVYSPRSCCRQHTGHRGHSDRGAARGVAVRHLDLWRQYHRARSVAVVGRQQNDRAEPPV
jgi:hypothetical protein